MKKKIIVLAVVAVLIALGYGIYKKLPRGGADKAAPQAIPVTAVQVQSQDFYPSLSFVSKIEAKDQVDVRARVTGFLTKRLFKEGDFVKEGQLLFEIEKDQFKASVNNAQANLAKAEANESNAAAQFKRAQNLFKTKDISEARLDERQAEYSTAKAIVKQAQAELDIANLNLNYTDVLSPISGRIGSARYSTGYLIGPESGSLAKIVSIDPIYAVFSVSENQLFQMKDFWTQEGAENIDIEFVYANGTAYPFKGEMNFVDLALDEQMNTMRMRVSFENPNNELISGQYGRVEMRFKKPHKALLLASELILRDLVGPYVYIINEANMLERRNITEGLELANGMTVIEKGLNAGDKVLTSHLQVATRFIGAPLAVTLKEYEASKE
ncbi:MAG: efflux RND transporter periplasmic adaptor subunit [Alphaproteobacteria bacterium]|nr:efflux RND transporter periplasmic adaptor subunit [Alphaproteobacteria bacterium]